MFCRGRSNILKEKTKVKSNEECAKLCKEEPSCNHWTRRKKDYLGRCWLKKTDSCTKENHKYDSGINCKGEVTLSLTQFAEGLNIFFGCSGRSYRNRKSHKIWGSLVAIFGVLGLISASNRVNKFTPREPLLRPNSL